MEDLNRDLNLSTEERYNEYRIPLRAGMEAGEHHLVEVLETNVPTVNGNSRSIRWLHFVIPIGSPDNSIGEPEAVEPDFMRMVVTDFQDPVTLRFAELGFTGS